MASGKKIFLVNEFYGGASEHPKESARGGFFYGDNLDIRTDLSALGIQIKTTKDSSTTVTDLPKFIEHDAVNDKTYAYGDDGNFYAETAGTWSALTAPTTAHGQGMNIWNDYVYLRKDSAIARYGPLSSSPSITQSWQSSNIQTITDHAPILEFQGNNYFANGRYLAEWDNTTFTYNRVVVPIGWKIRALAVVGENLVMGGWKGTNVYDNETGFLWFWNGTDDGVSTFIEIQEGPINAMATINNNLFFVAGSKGNLYHYNGVITPVRQLSTLLLDDDYIDVFPGAMTSRSGDLVIGLAGKTDSAELVQGVYTYGRSSKNYPRALNISNIISTGTKAGTTLKIGALHTVGPNEFYVGWEDGTSTNGIDKVSGTTPYAIATYNTLWFDDGEPNLEKEIERVKFTFKPLRANESLDFYYRLDRASSWQTILGTASTVGTTEKSFAITPMKTWKEIQFRIDLKTSGSTSPSPLSISMPFSTRELT